MPAHEVPEPPDPIEDAAAILRAGGLVAFPTETVYGLGADAGDPAAVSRIFEAKGRPADHPLIVHLAAASAMADWCADVPALARRAADAFWPGPLTLVLPRASSVNDAVTGGLPTVAVRVPDHPVALALLEAHGGGVAAPSANRFGSVSPTTAAHVALELGARCDRILDGGACRVGIESTILSLVGEPRVLRPGGVSHADLERALGLRVARGPGETKLRAPGMLASHYAPRASVVASSPDRLAQTAAAASGRVVVLAPQALAGYAHIELPTSGRSAAALLYAALHEVDAGGFDAAVVCLPESDGIGEAVADRIRRAATPEPFLEPGTIRH